MVIVEPKSGQSLVVKRGQILRVTDIEGAQVADFVCFNLDDYSEFFSQSKTRLYNMKTTVTTNDPLYSNLNNVMFTILEDKVEGVHDLYFAPCNSYLYETVAKVPGKTGCQEHLAEALASYNISEIPDPFNIFMNSSINERDELLIHKPVSEKDDYIDLRAEMDCLVAVSSCADDLITECNGGVCTPIMLEVRAQ